MREITEIIVHCSATPPDWMEVASIEEKRGIIRGWHRKRGFSREGYHHFIDQTAAECEGRPDSMEGAHVRGHNSHTLGVCLIGGHGSQADDLPGEHFTPEQLAKLRSYIQRKLREYPTITKVSGHNEYAAKACPGFNVRKWWDGGKKTSPAPKRINWWARLFGK